MKSCSICKAAIEAAAPSILTMGAYGNPRYACEACDKEIEKMLLSREPDGVFAAMKVLGDHLARTACEDNSVIATVKDLMDGATERAEAIKAGTYDFSLDGEQEEELVEVPEELRETEEDRALDARDERIAKKWDKAINVAWYIALGLFAVAFVYLLIRRFF